MTGPADADPDAIRVPDRRMIAVRVLPPVGRPPGQRPPHVPPQVERSAPPSAGADDLGVRGDAGVRPFVMTSGRTAPADERLRIETQVVATRQAEDFALDFESKQIVDLCRTPLSVAEIGSALGLPIVVARVLVADLVAIGAVAVQEQETPMSRALLERILERVHAL